jgi:hypothetical protein
MRKIIFRGHAKTVGTDFAEAVLYTDDTPDSVLDHDCWQAAIDNAEMYGYEYVGSDFEYEDDEEEEDVWDRQIDENELGYYWEEYDSELHDGHRMGGGSFEKDFAKQAERM